MHGILFVAFQHDVNGIEKLIVEHQPIEKMRDFINDISDKHNLFQPLQRRICKIIDSTALFCEVQHLSIQISELHSELEYLLTWSKDLIKRIHKYYP